MRTMTTPPTIRAQRGAALIIGLILLAVLTVLGVTGMSTSLLDLNMMLNSRESLNAFEVTQSALSATINSNETLNVDDATLPGDTVRDPITFELREAGDVVATANTRFVGFSDAVPLGWEQGESVTVHFQVDSDSTTTLRGAGASQSAGFYIVAPTP
jgi:type IV pilus assembly protein PilX